MTFFKVTFFFLFFALLSHCNLPSPRGDFPSPLQGQGSFYIESFSGRIVAIHTYDDIALPRSVTASYRACLRDRKARTPIMNQGFDIRNEETQSLISAMTDNAGCVNWSEEILFPFFKTARNIMFRRMLTTQGRFSGQHPLTIVVNPWMRTVFSDVEVDLQAQNLMPITMEELLKQPDTAIVRVYPNRSIYAVNEIRGRKASFRFDFMGSLRVEYRDHLDQIHFFDVNRARYRSRVTILNRRKDGLYYLIHKTKWSGFTELRENIVNIETTFESNTAVCPNGRLDYALELDLSNSNFQIRPFEMIFQGPDCSARGNIFFVPYAPFIEYVQKTGMSLEEYLVQNVHGFITQDVNTNGDVAYLRPLTFEVSSLSVRGFQVQKVVRTMTCLSSSIDPDVFKRERLTIISHNGIRTDTITDDFGCFAWNEAFDFNYFEPQCWREGVVKVISSAHDWSMEIGIGYSAVGDRHIFQDLRYFRIPESERCRNHYHKGEIFLDRFTRDKTTFQYLIDEHLNMKIQYNMAVQTQPKLRRVSFLDSSGIIDDDIQPGPYLMRIAIADIFHEDIGTLSPDQVYFYGEFPITVRARSLISAEIPIIIDDLFIKANTTRIFIQILPDDEDSQAFLRDFVFEGPVEIFQISESIPLRAQYREGFMAVLRNRYEERVKTLEDNQRRLSQVTEFAKREHLELIDLGKPEQVESFITGMTRPLALTQWRERENLPPLRLPRNALNGLNAQRINDWINGVELGHFEQISLCRFWFAHRGVQARENRRPSFLNLKNHQQAAEAVRLCWDQIRRLGLDSVFILQNHHVVRNPRRIRSWGEFREMSLNEDVRLSRYVTDSSSRRFAWDVFTFGVRLPDIPGLDFIRFSSDVRFSIDRTFSDAASEGRSESIVQGVSVVAELLWHQIEAPLIRRCLSIRLNPSLFEPTRSWLGTRSSYWAQLLHPDLNENERNVYLNQGLMICEDESLSRGGQFIELFSTFNQRINNLMSMDAFDPQNRPFYIHFRGEKNYLHFLTIITGTLNIPEPFRGGRFSTNFVNENLRRLFINQFPTYPGMTQSTIQWR